MVFLFLSNLTLSVTMLFFIQGAIYDFSEQDCVLRYAMKCVACIYPRNT